MALLDAHTLIWTMDSTHRLSERAEAVVTDPDTKLLLSTSTLWEVGIKVGLGKLTLSLPYREWMERAIADLSLGLLSITPELVEIQTRLPLHHRDPFDRLVVCHALQEQVPIVGIDSKLDAYGITRIW